MPSRAGRCIESILPSPGGIAIVTTSRPAVIAALLLCLVAAAAPASGTAREPDAEPLAAREVFGFFTASERDYMIEVADFSVLSTVAFFGLAARADGTLARTTPSGAATPDWAAWNSDWMDQVMAKARANGVRVVLTVTRFGWTPDAAAATVELLSNETSRARLAAEIADVVAMRGADGVNLDFEPIPAEVSAEFVDFVREVRTALDAEQAGLQLTFDAMGYPSNYDIAALTAPGAADAVFVMGYDYHGTWSENAGAVSPLSGLAYDLTDTVANYLTMTSADKIIFGLPYYGREWPTTTRYLHSPVRPLGATYGHSKAWHIDDAISWGRQKGVRWDDEQLVPWTRWRSRACQSCPRTWRQLYYENRRSLALKYDLIARNDLAGVGFWRIGMEGDRPALYELIADKLLQ